MKNHLFTIIAFGALISLNHAAAQQNPPSPALQAMAKKLAGLKSVNYHYHRQINNIANDNFSELDGNCYVEFDQTDKRSVTRFQMESNDYKSIYNGTEAFLLDNDTKTYSLTVQPKPGSFSNSSFFFNSIQTLRSVVQQFVESDTIPKHQRDTVIENKTYQLVQVDLHRSSLQYLGSTMHFTKDVTIYYRIVIDPATSLPYQVLESNNIDKTGYNTKTVFTDVNTSPKEPDAYSWYYTTYQKDYQPAKKEKVQPLIAAGAMLMDWSLPELSTGKAVQGADVKGKVVLMDFWIKNCGYCMESFPLLQQLQKKYGTDKFQLLAINAYDKKEDVAFFYKREKPVYKMLYTGAAMAKSLGVGGYPTVILLDKSGKVIYSGGFDHDKLEGLIKANM
ncbi:MAG: TlpA disulfide reductase family protein [Bacteroidota bacterium]